MDKNSLNTNQPEDDAKGDNEALDPVDPNQEVPALESDTPMSDDEIYSMFVSHADPEFEENDHQSLEEFLELNPTQYQRQPEENAQDDTGGSDPEYIYEEVQPLEDIRIETGNEIDLRPAIQDEQPGGEYPQPYSEENVPMYSVQEVSSLDDIDIQSNDEIDPGFMLQIDKQVGESSQPVAEGNDPINSPEDGSSQGETNPQTGAENSSQETYPVSQPSEGEMQQPNESVAPLESSFQPVQPAQENQPAPQEISPASTNVVITPEVNPKKIALILSGGGARGAFQVGAEMYARQVKGYHWDIIAGVSVGAMNGAMLSMHRYARLLEIWETISDEKIYTGGFNLPSVIKLLFGSRSFYGNEPLKQMMKKEFEAGKIIDDLHVGAVSLLSGEYVQFTKEFFELPAAILASSSIPVIWPPVDISPDHMAMVDGGVRNNSPVGDVLDLEPDEIVIINCSPESPTTLTESPANVLSIGMRALDIMQNEIFVSDIKEFVRINALVKEAEEQGVVLHHPRTGRPLKYYPSKIIEPDGDLGETLDFSQQAVQKALKMGVRRAREALGRD